MINQLLLKIDINPGKMCECLSETHCLRQNMCEKNPLTQNIKVGIKIIMSRLDLSTVTNVKRIIKRISEVSKHSVGKNGWWYPVKQDRVL